MSSTNGEAGIKDLTDKATYERLEKDVTAVKNDISALTDHITDALNSFAGTARTQARRGYKQARANVDSAVDDMSERGGAMMDAATDAAPRLRRNSLRESPELAAWLMHRLLKIDLIDTALQLGDHQCNSR